PAIESDRIRSDARGQRNLIKQLCVEPRDLHPHLARARVPIERNITVNLLQAGGLGGDRLSFLSALPKDRHFADPRYQNAVPYPLHSSSNQNSLPIRALLSKTWVRIASSVLSAINPFPFNKLFAESTLEAMRTQGDFCDVATHDESRRRAYHSSGVTICSRVVILGAGAFSAKLLSRSSRIALIPAAIAPSKSSRKLSPTCQARRASTK